jgi:hypothetical protein
MFTAFLIKKHCTIEGISPRNWPAIFHGQEILFVPVSSYWAENSAIWQQCGGQVFASVIVIIRRIFRSI